MMNLLDFAQHVQELVTRYAVTPLLVLFIGIFIAKICEQALLFFFAEFKKTSHPYTYSAYIVKWSIYVATVLTALSSIGVLRITLWFFAGVVFAVIAVRLLLSLLDFFPNFFSYHAVKQRYKEGSKVRMMYAEGNVVRVQLLDTHIRTADGDDLFIPNSTLLTLKRTRSS